MRACVRQCPCVRACVRACMSVCGLIEDIDSDASVSGHDKMCHVGLSTLAKQDIQRQFAKRRNCCPGCTHSGAVTVTHLRICGAGGRRAEARPRPQQRPGLDDVMIVSASNSGPGPGRASTRDHRRLPRPPRPGIPGPRRPGSRVTLDVRRPAQRSNQPVAATTVAADFPPAS